MGIRSSSGGYGAIAGSVYTVASATVASTHWSYRLSAVGSRAVEERSNGVGMTAASGRTRDPTEPSVRVYEVPVDRAVLVTREVLVRRGYVVYRVQPDRGGRIVWVRRGPPADEIVGDIDVWLRVH